MIRAVRPLWSEGMLLSPQHLQQQDLYHEQLLDLRLRALSSTPWGLRALGLDLAALASGSLELTAFSGVLPDGTPLHFDHQTPARPPARPIAPHFHPRDEALPVYLALPHLREGAVNLAPDSDPGARTRLRGGLCRVFDLYRPRHERELQVAELAPLILFHDEARDDFSALPIAELIRDPAGGFAPSPTFVPPALAISAAPNLLAALGELLARLAVRRRLLLELPARDLEHTLELHALARALPWLRHGVDAARDTGPLALYHALLDLAGALLASADLDALPAFHFTDLRATFFPLLDLLQRRLARDLAVAYLEVPLRPHQGNSWLGELRDERLAACTRFVLLVEPEGDLVVAAREIPAVAKVASWRRIPAIVRQNALGVPLRAALRPPPELPQGPRTICFHLDAADPQWHEVVADQRVAIHLRAPYDPQRARVRLLALTHAESDR